jgi:NADPH:quinone reductase-like Zn-dependent oxidoreductase
VFTPHVLLLSICPNFIVIPLIPSPALSIVIAAETMSTPTGTMPATMKASQFASTSGGLEKHLKLNQTASPPAATLSPEQVSVEVISMSLNPVDYKIPELPLVGGFIVPSPASPGIDYCGRVVSAGAALKSVLQPGQLVFGRLEKPAKFGTLGQYIIAPRAGCVLLPSGVDPDHAAAIGTAALTAYQCIFPNVKSGDKVFINGGSGGTGVFGIQFAKVQGCHVTTSCSTPNVQLCKDLGADEVIDYTTTNVSQELKSKGMQFSLVIDNVGEPHDLYKAADHFLKEGGKFLQVGAAVSMSGMSSILSRVCWPSLIGGGKRKLELLQVKNNADDFVQIGEWMKEGKVRAVIDSTFELEDAAKAYEKLKTGRARGKIVVHVTEKP